MSRERRSLVTSGSLACFQLGYYLKPSQARLALTGFQAMYSTIRSNFLVIANPMVV